MKRVLKVAGYVLAGLVSLVVLIVAGAFVGSEAMIRWPVARPASTLPAAIAAATDPDALARGKRLAKLTGCHDCHGDNLEGKLFHDEMPILRAYAPNLSRALAGRTDAEIDLAIRHGVGVDGRRLWVMPSSAFSQLSDRETADLIAYLRTYRPAGEIQPRIQVGPVGRIGVLLGKFSSEPDTLAKAAPRLADAGSQHAEGRALARLCVECHGPALEGSPMMKSPDLSIAASYDAEDFERLMSTGVAAGGRKIGLMTAMGPARFHALTREEVAALHGYLKARAQVQIAEAETKALSKP
ncbi:MAG: c-type cytochrome [Pseudomonadota bacterium]